MFKNINNTSKELGLAERTQPSAAEIYTPQGIPTGGAMPSYTQTQTAPQIFNVRTSQEGPFKELRSKKIDQLYEQDDENLRDYFACIQEEYTAEIDVFITDLKRWRIEIRARKRHYPRREDYEEKRMELCNFLYVKSQGYPFEQYFSGGADDTADAGAYLITLIRSAFKEKDERYAVVLLSGIQWLIRERDSLSVDISVEASAGPGSDIPIPIPKDAPPSAEENEQAELRYLIEKLKLTAPVTEYDLNEENTDNQEMLAAVRLAYFIEGKKWANNVNAFSIRIADCQNDNSGTQSTAQYKSDTFRNRMRRKGPSFSDDDYNQYLKGDKQLQPQIRNYYKKWEEKVTYVQQLLTLFRTDTGQNGQTPDNNG